MIKIKDIVGLPSLNYHLENGLSLSENVYRYSSERFIQLFAEARDAWRDGLIELNEEDAQLLESTDIGEYGVFEGEKVPLDLPMVDEETVDYDFSKEELIRVIKQLKRGASTEIGMIKAFEKALGRELTDDEIRGFKLEEAEYKGKDVALNKPKRGGPKKFYVYVKNPKTGNVKKVNFGDSGNLSVKIKEPGARASFAARHNCDKKKDKTKPGYWSCNIGRYWKSLGGSRNFSGYW
jgi:hypothetical protein